MAGHFAEVAAPLPLPGPLTYAVPDSLADAARPGCRVRVSVGPRRLVGVLLRAVDRAPEGVRAKELLEVLDVEPVLTAELLELATFVADYYFAPIGETVRALLPAKLPPWGDRRVSLTDGGALAPARDPFEATLVSALMERPRSRLAELRRELPVPRLAALVDRMRRDGRVVVEEPGRRGIRYQKAIELRPGDLGEQLEACGRSPKARAAVEYLAALGRPATVREVTTAVSCGAGVLRRLETLGLARQFSQPERLGLARHRLPTGDERPPIVLRADQQAAAEPLVSAVEEGGYRPFLLHGMTGSGKTEVYLRAVDECLRQGKTAILLVPEIALVPALARGVSRRYGRRLAILHSNLSSVERQQEWERLRHGEARVVLGPRSALLAPVADLGLVVVDEEHDGSYKQDQTPRYNGRDLALWRAREHSAAAVLVSATPSLESRLNVERDKLTPLMLTARAGHGALPEQILVDLRQEKTTQRPGEVCYSQRLRQEIEIALADGDQVILLRNRRGYAPVLMCRACGEDFRCPDCGLPRTFHRSRSRLICHYCDDAVALPARCPACSETALEPIGAGTERVEEQLREIFPDAAVDVLDADANRRPGGAAAVLERFANGTTQVLVGTQMVSKGHHFPNVALAAVLSADSYLSFPDFRAVERTYALLTQLAGRAGRGERPGRVVIQTRQPEHYAIRAALAHDDAAFAETEMRFRRTFHYPPYTRMVQLLAQHRDRDRARRALSDLARRCAAHGDAAGVRFSGPAPAPLERLRGRWRFQLLLRATSSVRLRRLLRGVLADGMPQEVTVDVDPSDLM